MCNEISDTYDHMSHVPSVLCLVPAMKVVSTGAGGHGVFPFSVEAASENKHSLSRGVKYTRTERSSVKPAHVSCELGHEIHEEFDFVYFIQTRPPSDHSVGGEHGLAPAPLSSALSLSLSKNESCCKAGPGNSATQCSLYGKSLDKSILIFITFPWLDVVLTLVFPVYIAVSCSPMFSVTRPRAKFSLFCPTFLARSNIHFLLLFL